jgi:acetyl esterase/lipase
VHDVVITADLVFRHVDGADLLADLHRPSTPQPPPVVVHVHGGGFRFGTRTDGAGSRLSALAAHGIAVLSIDYRLAPLATYPAPVEDVGAAVSWVRDHAVELGVDGERLALWGVSAGGLLASLTALDAAPDAGVGAVVAWFPLTDLEAGAARSPLERAVIPLDLEAALLGLDDGSEIAADAETAERARRASPVRRVRRGAPPFLIAHGDRDRITPPSQSRALHDALVAAGVESTLLLLGGAGHEGSEFDTPAHLSLTAAWLLATLGEAGRRTTIEPVTRKAPPS